MYVADLHVPWKQDPRPKQVARCITIAGFVMIMCTADGRIIIVLTIASIASSTAGDWFPHDRYDS